MQTRIRYACEFCGKSFVSEEACIQHEQSHIPIEKLRLEKTQYSRGDRWTDYGSWPCAVVLSDGTKERARYTFEYYYDEEDINGENN